MNQKEDGISNNKQTKQTNFFKIDGMTYVEYLKNDNLRSIVISIDDSYDDFNLIADYIQKNDKFQVLSIDGLTDMILNFKINNIEASLIYQSYNDGTLVLEANCNNEQEINNLRTLSHHFNLFLQREIGGKNVTKK